MLTPPDLRNVDIVALDTETRDDGLAKGKGPGWPWGDGHVCGISVGWREGNDYRATYLPLRHPDSACLDRDHVYGWLRELLASDARIVTQNGLYDFGWLRTEADIKMPRRLEEIGALATIVDENRFTYNLDDLCAWQRLPGKDDSLLREAVARVAPSKKKRVDPRAHLYLLPSRDVAPYAEADAIATLRLWESLNPVLDKEGTRDAYRLEVDLLPMVHEMRRRGIRIDETAAQFACDEIRLKRDAVLKELSEKLGEKVGMEEVASRKWLVRVHDAQKIEYPRTEKGNPSFTDAWMPRHEHWLPRAVVQINRYDCAAEKFLQTYIIDHVKNGRVYSEVHPHRSDAGGTRSLRFSYSNPPLQQMTAHDEELAPLIRGAFLPEEGEVWAKPDVSQQEYRFIVHYAEGRKLPKAKEAADRYREDPNTDFHRLVVDWTGLPRQQAKNTNFAKSFGAGVKKFAAMIEKSEEEAYSIYQLYDRELPFVKQLSRDLQREAARDGFTVLYDGARRHWDTWEPRNRQMGPEWAPVERREAWKRILDPHNPFWYAGQRPKGKTDKEWFDDHLQRGDVRKAMNALIQGSAARHTKLAMREIFRAGVVPLLQMHDSVDCSVKTKEEGEMVARIMRGAVQLTVPIVVDLKFGRTWGDANHPWEDL
jgi:DNA polymerase I-like protein with 3'-5' exonuclease and polymerase domains